MKRIKLQSYPDILLIIIVLFCFLMRYEAKDLCSASCTHNLRIFRYLRQVLQNGDFDEMVSVFTRDIKSSVLVASQL